MSTIRKLSPALEEIAKEEINETSDRKIYMALKRTKQWLTTQPHLKVRMDDQWLAAFVRGSKFSLELVQEKLNNFYTIRTTIPEFFKNKDPTKSPLKELIPKGVFVPIKNNNNNRAILFFRGDYDPADFDMNVVLKLSFMLLDILMYEDDNINVVGVTVVCDMKNLGLRHLAQFTPMITKKCLFAYIEAYPLRFDAVHFVNPPLGFQTILDLIKLLLPKLKDRFQTHDNFEDLYKKVPKENLPKEYGGDGATIPTLIDECKLTLDKYKDWLIEDDKYCSDESLRPGGPITTEKQFGTCSVM